MFEDSADEAEVVALQGQLQTALPSFDPTQILGLIQAIFALISSCSTTTAPPTPVQLQDVANRRPVLMTLRVRSSITRHNRSLSFQQVTLATDGVFTVCAKAAPTQLAAFVRASIANG